MARNTWEPKVTHARFVVGAFSSDQMLTLGNILAGSMRDRISRGLNVYDLPAKALNAAYAKGKAAKGRNPVRDWTMSGNTLRALQCIAANENRALISFNNPIAGRIAHWNNIKERAFGVSPRDEATIVAAVIETAKQARIVRVVKAA